MDNINENVKEPDAAPNQSQYTGGYPRKEYFRDDPRYKSPILATLLSIMPGLGQIYVGYYQQGFINIVVIASIISLLNYDMLQHHLYPFLGLFLAFYWLYNMVDAYSKATYYNQGLAGLRPFGTSEAGHLPGAAGSLVAGVFMLVAGALALAYTRFGMTLEWIQQWWPLMLILMGAYLLYHSLARKKK